MNTFESPRTVIIGVDIQNDFIDGSLAVAGGQEVVEPFNRTAEAARKIGSTVILTRDWHPKVTPHFQDYGGIWVTHCVADTPGADFHPDLVVTPNDIIISKGMGQTDGFSGWEGVADDGQTIESIATPRTATEQVRIILGGIATEYCVKATGLDVANRFKTDDRVTTYLMTDAIRGVEIKQGDSARAIKEMTSAGIIPITSAEVIAMIEASEGVS